MEEKKKSKFKKGLEDFKNFALKDNVLSLVIAVIIGTAFKDLVDSLVNNIFTPPIGFLTANIDFSNMFITLGKQQYDTLEQALEDKAVVLQYGLVLNSFISFFITAIVLYFVVKAVTKATRREDEKKQEKKTKTCPYCKSEIHLKAKKCPNCTSDLD